MTSLATQYLDAVQAGLTRLERQLPSIAAAATRAAERACAGGRVWALSDEEGFVSELQHRASGLMMVRGIPGGETFALDDGVSPEDVVIAATQDNAADRQGALLDGLADRGVAVTLIGSADSPLRPKVAAFIDTGLPAGNAPVLPYGKTTICPLASALNISAGWLWCIELANACAALGREPVFLMSGGLATGLDRNAQHEGKAFHDPGEYTIVPSPAGQKGRELLSEWLRCLVGIRATELDKIAEIGAVAAATRAAGHAVWCASIGHNLYAQRGLTGDPGFFRLIFPERDEKADLQAGDFFIYNGYYTFPDEELPAARATVEAVGMDPGRQGDRGHLPPPGRDPRQRLLALRRRQHQPAGLRRAGGAALGRDHHGHALAPARGGRRPHPRLSVRARRCSRSRTSMSPRSRGSRRCWPSPAITRGRRSTASRWTAGSPTWG